MEKAIHEKRALLLAEVLWNYQNISEMNPGKADIILGLGSYDLRVAVHCAQLYKDNLAPEILFSGCFGNWTKGIWSKTEAETFKEQAIACGVPEEAILTEIEATNTGDNIKNSKRFVAERGKNIKKVLLVTKPQTLRRAYATAIKHWPEVEYGLSAPRHPMEEQVTETHSLVDLINEMVGDMQRIKIYPNLGYQVYQEIPAEVENAYLELVTMGFTGHLISPVH